MCVLYISEYTTESVGACVSSAAVHSVYIHDVCVWSNLWCGQVKPAAGKPVIFKHGIFNDDVTDGCHHNDDIHYAEQWPAVGGLAFFAS